MNNKSLTMWVIYDHPKDHPNYFVARRHEVFRNASKATGEHVVSKDLKKLRKMLEDGGKVRITRDPNDDPVIIETWI